MHVLSLPPAFVLSQDQTLKFNTDMVAECTFAYIDEKTTQISKLTEINRDRKSSHKKTCTHRKSSTSTRLTSSFSSQEPRRPRFSFFCLHNVKELTHRRHRLIRRESRALTILQETEVCLRLPGSHPALSRKTPISGSHISSRRQRQADIRKS